LSGPETRRSASDPRANHREALISAHAGTPHDRTPIARRARRPVVAPGGEPWRRRRVGALDITLHFRARVFAEVDPCRSRFRGHSHYAHCTVGYDTRATRGSRKWACTETIEVFMKPEQGNTQYEDYLLYARHFGRACSRPRLNGNQLTDRY
jgi:hypothetical protein